MGDNIYNDYKFYNYYKSYIPQEGGYKALPFFKQAEIIHDFTVKFAEKYINPKSRTKDQMEQAARSGKQNIAEGYQEKGYEARLKFLGYARGSLEELLNDYQDYLRQHDLKIWDLNSPEAKDVRGLVYKHYNIYNNYKNYKPDLRDYLPYLDPPEAACNAMICLINQTNQLLDQKIRWTQEKFVKEGGFRENLFKKRQDYLRKI